MSLSEQYNVGARIFAVPALEQLNVRSSSTNATTEAVGVAIDRQALGRQYYSCKALVAITLTGASSQRIVTVAAGLEHSDSSGGTYADYSTASNVSTVVGTSSSGSTKDTTGGQQEVAQMSIDLNSAKRWIRIALTPTFGTSSSGDAVDMQGVIVFGGADELPAQ